MVLGLFTMHFHFLLIYLFLLSYASPPASFLLRSTISHTARTAAAITASHTKQQIPKKVGQIWHNPHLLPAFPDSCHAIA